MREDDYDKILNNIYKDYNKDILYNKDIIYKKDVLYELGIYEKIKNDAWNDDDDWNWKRKHIVTTTKPSPKPSNEEILEGMPIEEIERFLRKKKLERINGK